jgi:WS/DGAT/MGAT family acyltransferase
MAGAAVKALPGLLDPAKLGDLRNVVAPRTPLNKSISSERAFGTATISLTRARAVGKAAGGKLNDVVLALSSGVLRRYLLETDSLPKKSLSAAVPVSLREEGDGEANNQAFAMTCQIATHIADPKDRMAMIITESTKSKALISPLKDFIPLVSNASAIGMPMTMQVMALLYTRSGVSDILPPTANVIVSNVPGPRMSLYAAGAELLHLFPVSIATHGMALNITVQGYRDQLEFGLIAGANVLPDVQRLADMLEEELAVLEEAYASVAA